MCFLELFLAVYFKKQKHYNIITETVVIKRVVKLIV